MNSFVDNVNFTFMLITGISVVLLIGITFMMIYFVVKYNRKKSPKAVNIHGNTALEVTWTVIPLILSMGMFYYGWIGYDELSNPPKDAMVVKAIGKMWKWEFEYAGGIKSDTLFAPQSKAVRINITSVDVNHSLYIPALRFKRDAIPNRVNFLWFSADKLGTYDIACAQYCGVSHSKMYTALVVMPEKDFNTWLENQKAKNAPAAAAK